MTVVHPALTDNATNGLVGIGLYTFAEAGRLIGVNPTRIARWVSGHTIGDRRYAPLWAPQIDLGGAGIFLGFRDLQEARVATAFIDKGLSPQRVRQAIGLARDLLSEERPLSTSRFRTDGRSIFLQVAEEDGQVTLLDLLRRQYAFREIIDRSLTNVEFNEAGAPTCWWPMGRSRSIVIDPHRAFGQPIETETSVPTVILAAAAKAEGSVAKAARLWDVPPRAIHRAMAFEDGMASRTRH